MGAANCCRAADSNAKKDEAVDVTSHAVEPDSSAPLQGSQAVAAATASSAIKAKIHSERFIVDNPGKVRDFYHVAKKRLGEGSFGKVSEATHKGTGAIRAIKTIAKAGIKDMRKFNREIEIMKSLDHPNIIKLYETFQDAHNICLVMEVCKGGELFDRIVAAGNFSEVQAAVVMQQIFRSCYYMHENKVCHRDIKPENFLFASPSPIDSEDNLLKVIDFGLSCRFTPGQRLTTKAGTACYIAPQCLKGDYDESCDLWSIGVVMYVLLCGYPPFNGRDDASVLKKVKTGKYTFNPREWNQISEDAKELVRMLLQMDPTQRITAKQGLAHRWIKEKAPNSNATVQLNVVENLKEFQGHSHLKKAALHFIATQLDTQQIKNLRETFVSLDDNGNGQLTVAEMKNGLAAAGISKVPPDLQAIMDAVDSNGSGVIDYTEFLAASLDRKMYLQEDVCWQAFSLFDRDGNGTISNEELKLVLQDNEVEENLGASMVANLLQDIDANGDGMIDFQEFMQMMHKDHGAS
mmetsp:Transcript_19588/g.45554  ORF Transcript_19588/g.45554 Transcript_19588/m.45554 type:complete len:520 (+) Transcript_19588:208-1767(+)|eukprot:CAMPEP_0178404782 /NCGR_PEP_ID=MMETSP0689_2-20121128/18065_1 /TAXON_ID=160604 /ORGANISM="Amphidinium massartii, Strain CS-259" /LENGTH=519 /DNA_ID=CAMNT_0020025785 /DNA_START=113 /DNA_END=1672 /DNA_ORIENTATION=+